MAGAFQYGGPSPMQLAGYVQGQGQLGKQQGEDSRLARLVSGAMTDPSKRQANLAEVASFRPEAAFAAQGQFDQQDQARNRRLGEIATIYLGAGSQKANVLKQFAPELTQFGMQLPPDIAPSPEIDELAQNLAQMYGRGQSEVPSEIRTLRMLQADPSLLETNDRFRGTYSFDTTKDRFGRDVTIARNSRNAAVNVAPLGGTPQGGEPPVSQPAPADPQAVQSDMMVLSRLFGVQPSSLQRDQATNDRVGGVPNSQHLKGTAGDFPVPEEMKPQFIAAARQLGYEAIDEGDHVHLELPPQQPGMVPAGGSAASAQPAPRLPSIMDIGGGEPSLGGPGYGQSDADRARAEADKAGRVEEAKLRSQLSLGGDVKAGEAEGEGLAKQGLERIDAIRQKAALASTQSASLDELERLLTQAYTGPGASTVLSLGKLGTLVGVGDGEKVSAAEAAQAISNRLALSLRNPAGGEGMPGAMSDADRAFLQSSIPSLQNTPDGWKQMIAFQRKLNEAAMDQAREVERFLASGGKPRDVYAHMRGYAERNPVFAGNGGQQGGQAAGQYSAMSDDELKRALGL